MPLQIVRPAVVTAANLGELSFRQIDYLCRAMAAHVMEGPERSLVVAHDQDRLAGDLGGDEGARSNELSRACRQLPGAPEDAPALQGVKLRIVIPGTGNRPRPRQR